MALSSDSDDLALFDRSRRPQRLPAPVPAPPSVHSSSPPESAKSESEQEEVPKKPKKRGRPPKGRKRTASPTVEVVVAPKQAAKPWQKSGTAAISLSSDDDDSDGSSWSRAKKKKRSVSPPKEEEEDLEDSLPPPPEINLDFTKRTVERAAARKIVDAAAAPKPTPVEIADDDSDLDLDPDLRDIRAKARPIPSVADRRTLDLKVFYTVLGAENETQESRTFTVPATATILDKYAEILAAFGLNERYEMRFLHARNRVLHSVPFSAMEELQQARRKTSSDKPSGVRLEMMSKNDFEGLTRYMEEERRRKLNPEPVSLDIDDEMDQETEETADNKGEQDVRLSIRFQDNGGEVKMEFRMKVARHYTVGQVIAIFLDKKGLSGSFVLKTDDGSIQKETLSMGELLDAVLEDLGDEEEEQEVLRSGLVVDLHRRLR